MTRFLPFLFFCMIIGIAFLTSLISADTSNAEVNACPEWGQKPENVTFLVAGEKWCPHSFFNHVCYSCCQQTDTVCCDDGSCMQYDQYGRYGDCCTAKYCDICTPTYGAPCGPVCAPRLNTQCCNDTTGQLCGKSDVCCKDFCCPASTFCCPSANRCLKQGETCCGTTSCEPDSFCCGNIPNKCCPNGYECVAESGGCCLPGQECLGAPEKCCNNGSHCCGDHCCPNNQICCGKSCCTAEHTCCDNKCCTSSIGCQGGGECCPQALVCGLTCCPAGQTCCGDHHCCPPGHQCCGNLCCPSGQSCCNSDKKCYPNGLTECVDRCCLPGTTCAHDQFGVQCCDHQYCGSTGRCCHPGTYCNSRGHCCNDNTRFCSGGSAEACYPMDATCCGDGTACPAYHPVCLWEGGSGAPVCCPPGFDAMCGGICIPRDYRNCQCCGLSCCVAPYSCDGGRCLHSYWTSCHHWWGTDHHCHYHTDEQPNDYHGVPATGRLRASRMDHSKWFLSLVLPEKNTKDVSNSTNPPLHLPPPPAGKINPASYPCFNDEIAMNDTCAAWDCLETIMKCGAKGPIVLRAELICKVFRELKNLFNVEGQSFLNCTAKCVTNETVSILSDYNIKPCCASILAWQLDVARFECWAGCGFCSAYMTNHVGFKALFEIAEPGTDSLSIYSKFCHLG